MARREQSSSWDSDRLRDYYGAQAPMRKKLKGKAHTDKEVALKFLKSKYIPEKRCYG